MPIKCTAFGQVLGEFLDCAGTGCWNAVESAQRADCNFRLSHLSKWKFMHGLRTPDIGHRTNDNEQGLGSGTGLGLGHWLGLAFGHGLYDGTWTFTWTGQPACLAFNALFTLDCLMKESLHSFIRFIHSFNSFASLLDSFMRKYKLLRYFFTFCLSAAVTCVSVIFAIFPLLLLPSSFFLTFT